MEGRGCSDRGRGRASVDTADSVIHGEDGRVVTDQAPGQEALL